MNELNLMLERIYHNLFGVVILMLLFYAISMWLTIDGKVAIRKISRCNDANEANRLRIKVRRRRKWITWLTVCIVPALITIVIMSCSDELYFSSFIVLYIVSLFFVAIIMQLFVKRLAALYGNIEPIDFREFDTNRPYSIFLRGFFSDELASSNGKNRHFTTTAFSERGYINRVEIETGHKVFAVGNPKELDSPYGAQRIYLNDSSWKEDVLSLMDGADAIHIRVCDTQSCLWEIQRASLLLNKVTLIVDDILAYNTIRAHDSNLHLPELTGDIGWTFYVLKPNQYSDWIVKRYKMTDSGYESVGGNTDKGGHLRKKRNMDEIVLPILFSIVLIAGAPDVVQWGKGIHEVRLAFDRLEWDKIEWASWIDERLPIDIEAGYTVSSCCLKDSSLVFDMSSSSAIIDYKESKALCGKALEEIFRNDDGIQKTFFNKVLADYRPLTFVFSHDSEQLMKVSVSEEDLINLKLLKRHIKGHRSIKEELDDYFENVPPPTVY